MQEFSLGLLGLKCFGFVGLQLRVGEGLMAALGFDLVLLDREVCTTLKDEMTLKSRGPIPL